MTITPTQSVDSSTSPANSAANNSSSAVTKDMFLNLMVTQLKYQDPLNPTDGVQYLSQLAQFTDLEQNMDIRQAVDQIRDQIVSSTPPASSGTPASGSNNSTTPIQNGN